MQDTVRLCTIFEDNGGFSSKSICDISTRTVHSPPSRVLEASQQEEFVQCCANIAYWPEEYQGV